MFLLRPSPGISILNGSFLRNRLSTARKTSRDLRLQRYARAITVQAKLKVNLVTIGKKRGKDAVFDPLVSEYTKRMSRVISVQEKSVKREAASKMVQELSQRESVMLMDEKGSMPRDSVHFSEMVFAALEQGGSRLSIVIGDEDGLPQDVSSTKGSRVRKVSLSPLTFTHKMVRK
ncbi:tRNA (guanine-N1-)-methyltransferase [Gracilaria domingensis]|nr:tRNA (guanine-N1-)-methyltransferase [Gracilaria domingensis]